VDLDQDGTSDFRFISFHAYGVHPTRQPGDPLYSYFRDDTVAYFAEKHVQMYLGPIPSGCAMSLPPAVLVPGTSIPAKPTASNSWQWTDPYAIPALKGIGFGHTRRAQTYEDPHIPNQGWNPGYLHAARPPILTNAVFGFRIESADGWHLGWLHLTWVLDLRPPETSENVRMVEYAVSPDPDTDMVAGRHVGPPLQITTSTTNGATGIRVSWPTNATNLILETKRSWTATNWMAVSGVTNNAVTITPWSSSAFFRLRGQ
jgi:hypothetical protein